MASQCSLFSRFWAKQARLEVEKFHLSKFVTLIHILKPLQLLVKTIDEAGTQVHSKAIKVKPPVRIPTPYGGRLVWTLPGKTKIVCHLKDKSKIRHKKRWSQIMYMYYLLGYKLMDLPISDARKQAKAENTYLLALDGDVDFQPEAVLRYNI